MSSANRGKISERLKEALGASGISQSDLALKTGIGKSSISMYVSGQHEPRNDRIGDLAKALHVSPGWLMGFDIPMRGDMQHEADVQHSLFSHTYPLLDHIADGEIVFISQEQDDYMAHLPLVPADYIVTAPDDSMRDYGILCGDIVFVRHQSNIEDNDIAVVAIEENILLRCVQKNVEMEVITLYTGNRSWKPQTYIKEYARQLRFLGKAVSVYHKL